MPIVRHQRGGDGRMRPVGAPHQPLRIGGDQRLVQRARVGIIRKLRGDAVGRRDLDVHGALADQPQKRLEIRFVHAARRLHHAVVIDDHRHRARNRAQRGRGVRQQPPVAEDLHHPTKLGHGLAEDLEHVEPDAAHVILFFLEQMKAQAAHADLVPVAQRRRRNARVGDGDAAQPLRITRDGVEHHAVVVAVRIALHDQTMRATVVIEQRDEFLDRRVGRRVAAPRRIGEFVGRPEHVRVAVPRTGRRKYARLFRLRDGTGDGDWFLGQGLNPA